MLIHGRYSYHRTAFVANYSFFKSLFICFMQISYQFSTVFSGTSLMNSLCLMAYNVVFTGLPIMGYVLDKDLPEHTISSYPFLYKDSQCGRSFNLPVFALWFVRAIFQALVVYLLSLGVFYYSPVGSNYASLSLTPFTVAIIVQTFTIAIESHSITIINHLLIWGTLASYFLVISIANLIPELDMYYSMNSLYSIPIFWLCIALVSVAAILPIVALKYIFYNYFPTPSQILSYLAHLSVRFSIPFHSPPSPLAAGPAHSSSYRRRHPERNSLFSDPFTDPDSQWVVQMIKFEDGGEAWTREGGTFSDKTPLLNGKDRNNYLTEQSDTQE